MITIFKIFESGEYKHNMADDPEIPKAMYEYLGKPKSHLLCVKSGSVDKNYPLYPNINLDVFTIGEKYEFYYSHAVNPLINVQDFDWKRRLWEFKYQIKLDDENIYDIIFWNTYNANYYCKIKSKGDLRIIVQEFTTDDSMAEYEKRMREKRFDL